MHVIDFYPPMSGVSGEFNTFRLGIKWSRILKDGDFVMLVDRKLSSVIGLAQVQKIVVGKLGEVAPTHAKHNHNQKGLDEPGAPGRLISNMVKRYGPHKCDENKRVTVIYLRVCDGSKSLDAWDVLQLRSVPGQGSR